VAATLLATAALWATSAGTGGSKGVVEGHRGAAVTRAAAGAAHADTTTSPSTLPPTTPPAVSPESAPTTNEPAEPPKSLTPGRPSPPTSQVRIASDSGASSGSYVFELTDAGGIPVRWNPCAPIHFVTNLAEAPPGALAEVNQAVAAVSAATGISFVWDGATSELPSLARPVSNRQAYPESTESPVLIAWAGPSDTDLYGSNPNLTGVGLASWVNIAGGQRAYVTGQIAINTVTTATMRPGFGAGITVGQLLLHELGHVMGLGHTTDPTQIMFPVQLPLPSASYGAGDLTGLAHLGAAAGCLAD